MNWTWPAQVDLRPNDMYFLSDAHPGEEGQSNPNRFTTIPHQPGAPSSLALLTCAPLQMNRCSRLVLSRARCASIHAPRERVRYLRYSPISPPLPGLPSSHAPFAKGAMPTVTPLPPAFPGSSILTPPFVRAVRCLPLLRHLPAFAVIPTLTAVERGGIPRDFTSRVHSKPFHPKHQPPPRHPNHQTHCIPAQKPVNLLRPANHARTGNQKPTTFLTEALRKHAPLSRLPLHG